MPPVVKTGTMDIFKTDELFREGKVAMNIEWIGFAEASINPKTSKVADKVAFAQMPGLQGRRRQDDPLVEHRRPALRADHLEHRRADQGGRRLREVVAVDGHPAPVRAGRRPERHQVGLQRSEVRDLPAVEPGLGAEPRLAEGRLARAGVLRAAGRSSRSSIDQAITGKQDAKTTLDNIATFQENLLKEAA